MKGLISKSSSIMAKSFAMIIIILAHCGSNLIEITPPHWVEHCGYWGTGVFFCLSGYGLTLSMNRSELNTAYLFRHLKKLFIPWFIYWMFMSLAILIVVPQKITSDFLTDFLQLGGPGTDLWFFRVIVILYIAYYILSKYIQHYNMQILTVVVLIYVIIAMFTLGYYWWNSIFCFPLGVLMAKYQGCFLKNYKIILALSVLCCFLCYRYGTRYYHMASIQGGMIEIISSISFSIATILMFSYIMKSEIQFVNYIGRESIYFYLLEFIPMFFFPLHKSNLLIYTLETILCTYFLVWGVNLRKYIVHGKKCK